MVTTHGSAALDHKPALADGALAAALKAAGVVSLGKTQVPEFGLTAYSENRIAPPSRNPHALSRSSGGSSGGSAAAVAAGLLPVRPRVRRRRLGPHPGGGLRAGGAQARPRAGAGRGKLRRSRRGWWSPGRWPAPRRMRRCCWMRWCRGPTRDGSTGPATSNSPRRNPRRLRIGVSLDSPWQTIFPFTPDPRRSTRWPTASRLLEAAGHETVGSRHPLRQPLPGRVHHRLDRRRRKRPDHSPARGAPDPADPDVPAPGPAAQRGQAQRIPGVPAPVPAGHDRAVRRLGPDADAGPGADTPPGGLVHRRHPRRTATGRPPNGRATPTATTASSANSRRGPPW